VRFTKASADRVAKAVRTVELGSRDSQGLHYDKALGGGSKVFRICTFTGTWSIDATKTITFRNQTTTPNTVTAVNLFAQVGASDPGITTPCAIAKDGSAWYLIAAKCL
jgi:hypothetical protein